MQLARAAISIFGLAPAPAAPATPAVVSHTGGIVGTMTTRRMVSPAIFVNAPRLHKGLAADEFPTILQRGESVIPRGGGGRPPNVIINNNTGSQMEQEGIPTFDGEAWVVSIVAKNINNNGILRSTIKGAK